LAAFSLSLCLLHTSPSSLSAIFAEATSPPAIRFGNEVLAKKRMAGRTCSFPDVHRREAVTTVHVDAMKDDLKMGGINTISTKASVVRFFVGRNRANEPFVGQAMSLRHCVLLKSEAQGKLPVTVLIARRTPEPTGVGLFDLLPETLNLVA
jgi:hypothetical protein